jgi:hypothetical protein
MESTALSRYAQLQKEHQAILGVRMTMGNTADLASHQHRGGHSRIGRDAVLAVARGGWQSRQLHIAIAVNVKCPAEAGHFISVVMGCVSRPLNLSSVKDADRQPLVTTGCGAGYLPIGYLPT